MGIALAIIGILIGIAGGLMMGQEAGWQISNGRATWDDGYAGMGGCGGVLFGALLMVIGMVLFGWGAVLVTNQLDLFHIVFGGGRGVEDVAG